MARTTKKSKKASSKGFSLFDESEGSESFDEEDLPKDEVGRQKIKQQYVDLLGIRIDKLKGRILNRERINKNLEGIYFICARCEKVCHNLDEGLIEDEGNVDNICKPCHEAASTPVKSAASAKSTKASKSSAKKSKTTKKKAAKRATKKK